MEIRHKTLRHNYSYVYQNSTLIAVIHSTFSIRQSASNILKEHFMTLLQIFNMSNTSAASKNWLRLVKNWLRLVKNSIKFT
jgi:hypothetical protein